MKKIIFIINYILIFNFSFAQISLNGPEGCDATYFLKTKYGYWLGTGSSGGIFFTKSLGEKWQCFNNPFGPAHIYWIGEVKNKIITNADGQFYEFQVKKSNWILITDSVRISELKIEELAAKNKELQVLKNIVGKNLLLDLPYDVNTLHFYNNDSVIVCTQSGLYLYDINTKELASIRTYGVIASDVHQIDKTSEIGLILLTQDNLIWGYKDKEWKKLFDYKETSHYKCHFIRKFNLDTALTNELKISKIANFYPKGNFNLSLNGMIILSMNNAIFVINPSNKQYEIISPPKNFILMEASLGPDGNIKAVGDFTYNINDKLNYKILTLIENKNWQVASRSEMNPRFPILSSTFMDASPNIAVRENSKNDKKNYSFLYPMQGVKVTLKNKTLQFNELKKSGYLGYYYQNYINSKIISGYYDANLNELYLGTYGSGIILIK